MLDCVLMLIWVCRVVRITLFYQTSVVKLEKIMQYKNKFLVQGQDTNSSSVVWKADV